MGIAMQDSTTGHVVPNEWTRRALRVLVIGCGGTGSQLLPRLAQLDRALIALEHPGGLEVTVFDPDQVAAHNLPRQNFVEADIGANKAELMVYRLNVAHGLRWRAMPRAFSRNDSRSSRPDIIFGCVDTRAARREIEQAVRQLDEVIWVDCGNGATQGQVVVGLGGRSVADDPHRLPLVTELFPEIAQGEDDDAPSCSALQSLLRQSQAVNVMAATWALAWLSQALRDGHIGWHGVFFDLATGRTSTIAVDPAVWANLGFVPPKAQAPRRRRAS